MKAKDKDEQMQRFVSGETQILVATTQQSGLPFELHIASLSTDGSLLELARRAAMEVLDADPLLEQMHNRIYKQRLDYLRLTAGNWGEISWDYLYSFVINSKIGVHELLRIMRF